MREHCSQRGSNSRGWNDLQNPSLQAFRWQVVGFHRTETQFRRTVGTVSALRERITNVRIQDARKALRLTLDAANKLSKAVAIAFPNNGDAAMMAALTTARDEAERAVTQLCKVVPNADIMHGRVGNSLGCLNCGYPHSEHGHATMSCPGSNHPSAIWCDPASEKRSCECACNCAVLTRSGRFCIKCNLGNHCAFDRNISEFGKRCGRCGKPRSNHFGNDERCYSNREYTFIPEIIVDNKTASTGEKDNG